jgi:glutamate 5-kinase
VFGDNDGLSAQVAVSLDADLLILLTNVDGVFTASPSVDPSATRIRRAPPWTTTRWPRRRPLQRRHRRHGQQAGGGPPRRGRGDHRGDRQRPSPTDLDAILAGEDVGTLIPAAEKRRARWRHIAISARPRARWW